VINVDEIFIKHYCHPKCTPYKNICRLPKKEAYDMAHALSANNPEDAYLTRFSETHFDSYYSRRMEVDKLLYDTFVSLGGKPKERHPVFFVLHHSVTLEEWVGKWSLIGKIKLKDIPSEFISFTLDDSMVSFKQYGKFTMYTKRTLLHMLSEYSTLNDFLNVITKNYYCIEAQLWNDDYCMI